MPRATRRSHTILSDYGIMLRPWLCLVVYLWALEVLAVYGPLSEPASDSLADAITVLWTLTVWIGALLFLILLLSMRAAAAAVHRINELLCRGGFIAVSAFFLRRWVDTWRPASPKFQMLCWLLLIVVALAYIVVRHRRIHAAKKAASPIPSWHECFFYLTLPVLVVSVAVIGFKMAGSVMSETSAIAFHMDGSLSGNHDRPNIILIVADSLRAQSMSLYGYTESTTPFLDQFAEMSSVYLETHSNGTTTVPGVFSLLTGKHPLTHGRLNRELVSSPESHSVVEILKQAGYQTAAITSNREASLSTLGLAMALSTPEVMEFRFSLFSWLMNFGVNPTRLGARVYRDLIASVPFLGFPRQASIFGNVHNTLGRAREIVPRLREPFFLFIHINEPHEPHQLPPNFKPIQIPVSQLDSTDKFALKFYSHYAAVFQPVVDAYKKEYERSIRLVDAETGAFLRSFEDKPWFRRSLVIFTSDHGESFERGYFYHGEEMYENATHIPLLIRFPNQAKGERVAHLTQSLDVAPTILNVLDIPLPNWMEGQPLRAHDLPRPVATVATNYKIPDEHESFPTPTKLAIWSKQYKMIVGCDSGRIELYDLIDDPGEQVNLVDTERLIVSDLKAQLKRRLAQPSDRPKVTCTSLS